MIFPITQAHWHGIEDARFVEFNDDGKRIFYATYTAYSGDAIRSELLETTDFVNFRLMPLSGTAAQNKGMALFPRKINGKFAMIARQDNENLYLVYSDDLYTWNGGTAILKPQFPWEFVQIGNCGSPIELDEGWLLLTHGVGPGPQIFHRRRSAGQERPVQGSGAVARAAGAARTLRAGRLCPECGLYLRGLAPQRPDHPALRRLRHLFQFRHAQDFRADAGDDRVRSVRHRWRKFLGAREASRRARPCGPSA